MKLSDEQRDLMKHTLGLDRAAESYRDYFCAGEDHADMPIISQLIELGMMWKSHVINDGRDAIYKVTVAGRKSLAAGGEILDVYGKPLEFAAYGPFDQT